MLKENHNISEDVREETLKHLSEHYVNKFNYTFKNPYKVDSYLSFNSFLPEWSYKKVKKEINNVLYIKEIQ
ncbi:hypothetical protein K9L67_03990 [Candidatus Woesearchaeota archaeon]|nr:hypothetical protein [Candidatus Woesearchaeota archaeon]